jgi:hypothetical protein
MTDLRDLLKRIRQWDALDIPDSDGAYWKREIDAALEQTVQEPVAWRWRMRNPTDSPGFAQPWNVTTYYPREQANEIEPLYTHPPRREPVQEAHIKELEQARERDNIAFKQLLAQRDALLEAQNGKKVRNHEGGTRYQPPVEDAAITSLRAALDQPEQEPLSDEELDRLWREPMSADWEHREFARAIEAAHGIKENT